MGVWMLLIISLGCVLVAGFFSGSETAFISVNKSKIRHLAEEKSPPAQKILLFLNDPDRLLSTVLVGTNLSIVSSSAIFTSFIIYFFGPGSAWMATLLLTPVILIFGEIIPKAIFRQKANDIVFPLVYPLLVASHIFTPIIRVVSAGSHALLKIFGQRGAMKKIPFVTREELRYLILESERGGVIDKYEKGLIYSIFNFGTIRAKEVMMPIDQLVCINGQKKVDALLALVRKKGHLRIPLYEGPTRKLVGFVSALDIFFEKDKKASLMKFARPLLYVSQDIRIDQLLLLLKSRHQQMAILTDDDNEEVGFLTLDDLLEELVGEFESR